jgi:hypothetical protein
MKEDIDDRLARLHRSGVLTPPTQALPMEVLRQPMPRAGHSVLAALIEEREEKSDVLAP